MKNYIFTVLISVIVFPAVFAQKLPEIKTDTCENFREQLFKNGKVNFGLKAGFNYSDLYGSGIGYIFAEKHTSWLPSFHIGVTVNSKIGKYFWLKHELLLIQKGAGVTLSDSINGNYASQLKMLSLDLFPLSPVFHYKALQLYAGPYISALVDAQIKRKDINGKEFNDHSVFGDGMQFENKTKYLQKFDFGINVGIEYEFTSGLSLGAKYTQGFTDLFQYANSHTFNDSLKEISIYNRSLLFSVGYSFHKK